MVDLTAAQRAWKVSEICEKFMLHSDGGNAAFWLCYSPITFKQVVGDVWKSTDWQSYMRLSQTCTNAVCPYSPGRLNLTLDSS